MSLKNRRPEYSWGPTSMTRVRLETDRKDYGAKETIVAKLSFSLIGGLREAFHPDVWTVSWEDFDKILRLYYRMSLSEKRGVRGRKLSDLEQQVRKASFYWSRDPDLPYRIWAMVLHEDGSAPKIPLNVEDAKVKMLDVEHSFEVPASSLGPGSHTLQGAASARWGRRSFIEKGKVKGESNRVTVSIE